MAQDPIRAALMATAKPRSTDAVPAVAPQTTPTGGYGGGAGSDFNGFIWQQLSEIQRTLGAVQESQRMQAEAHAKADEKASGKLGSLEKDLAEIKQIKHTAKWLLAVCSVVGAVVLAVVGFIAKEAWDLSKPALLEKLSPPKVSAPVAPAPSPKRP
jgi:hypothetical protein